MDTMINPAQFSRSSTKKDLIKQLDYAVALAREIEFQAKCIAKTVQEHHQVRLAA